MDALKNLVKRFFEEHKVADDHGWRHALCVLGHAERATESLDSYSALLARSAALLHDVDDRKLFKSTSYLNARKLMAEAGFTLFEIEAVVSMIDLVSASKNGNRNPFAGEPGNGAWRLIPRDADRLEAIGEVGVVRAYVYAIDKKRAMFDANTPCPTSAAELAEQVDLPARFERYIASGGSTSQTFLDHFYDKLLSIGVCSSGIPYLQRLSEERIAVMRDWLFEVNRRRKESGDEVATEWIHQWAREVVPRYHACTETK